MKARPEIEKHYHQCRMRLETDEHRLKICNKIIIAMSVAGILALAFYIFMAFAVLGYCYKIIEAEIFIYGSSDLLVKVDIPLFYGSIDVLVLLSLMSLINQFFHALAVNIILIFAMPIAAVFSVVCIATGQDFVILYVIMLIYTISMFVLQLIVLHALSDREELKKEDGYPQFNTILIDDKKGRYSNSEWNRMSAEEAILAEREGYYKGR